jgi:hypothetical protein
MKLNRNKDRSDHKSAKIHEAQEVITIGNLIVPDIR